MSITIKYPTGATPLDPNELNGLIPSYITTQSELDAAEQAGIIAADAWANSRGRKDVLTDSFTRRLHRQMFKLVWRWAGHYRTSDKSIGVHWAQVPTEVSKLLKDVAYWIEHGTYPWVELGARFHYRLVAIHPFPNGNGRHGRLMTDILLLNHGQSRFTWGSQSGEKPEAIRTRYIEALKSADSRKFEPLVKFVTM